MIYQNLVGLYAIKKLIFEKLPKYRVKHTFFVVR